MNPRVNEIAPSAIREIAAKKRHDSIDLGLGEPTLLPSIRYFEAALAWVRENGTRYTVNAGDPELRARIAARYAYPGMSDASNVCITTGSQEAVYVTIKTLLDPHRDELLIVEPAFPAYGKIAQLEGIAVRRVEMRAEENFSFDVGRILDAIEARTRMIVLCSPCNPTARVLRESQARALADGLLARGGTPVYLLHDEIYRELTYIDDAGYVAAYYPNTIVANSLSKSNALTGMRIGWTIAPAPQAAALVKTHAWVTSTANTFAQRVAREIFESAGGLREQVPWYRQQVERVDAILAGSGLRYVVPEGSFYAFVALGEVDSMEFAHRLIAEENVVAIPGSVFGTTSEGWLRVSWVAPIDDVREGIARIGRLLERPEDEAERTNAF